ncbi:MAG: response regulator [Candidatus Kaiserbacteria bacterium]|nr:response regulator [Candidatus Kaiserbacteria bacterium]
MPTKKKILWVEDDSFLVDIIAQRLAVQAWELIPAHEGVAALALAKEKQPDIIVLDILLPGMDGLEVLAKLKADESTKHIPVLMFSNFDDKEKVERSKTLGAANFFVKAMVDLDAIVVEIQKVVG